METFTDITNKYSHLNRGEQLRIALLLAPTRVTQRKLAKKLQISESLMSLALRGKRKRILIRVERAIERLYEPKAVIHSQPTETALNDNLVVLA